MSVPECLSMARSSVLTVGDVLPFLVCRRTSSLIMTSVIASLMPRDITADAAAAAAAATQLSYPMIVAMVVNTHHVSAATSRHHSVRTCSDASFAKPSIRSDVDARSRVLMLSIVILIVMCVRKNVSRIIKIKNFCLFLIRVGSHCLLIHLYSAIRS